MAWCSRCRCIGIRDFQRNLSVFPATRSQQLRTPLQSSPTLSNSTSPAMHTDACSQFREPCPYRHDTQPCTCVQGPKKKLLHTRHADAGPKEVPHSVNFAGDRESPTMRQHPRSRRRSNPQRQLTRTFMNSAGDRNFTDHKARTCTFTTRSLEKSSERIEIRSVRNPFKILRRLTYGQASAVEPINRLNTETL